MAEVRSLTNINDLHHLFLNAYVAWTECRILCNKSKQYLNDTFTVEKQKIDSSPR